jgi:hypothetical protein
MRSSIPADGNPLSDGGTSGPVAKKGCRVCRIVPNPGEMSSCRAQTSSAILLCIHANMRKVDHGAQPANDTGGLRRVSLNDLTMVQARITSRAH